MKLNEEKNKSPKPQMEPKNISHKMKKLHHILNNPIIDINELKNILWGGITCEVPFIIREKCWKLALGYLPLNREDTEKVLKKKRDEYENLEKQYYNKNKLSEDELKILRQIKVDIPRTKSCYNIFNNNKIQQLSERVLFIYSVRHPACGYVQGINDLITPFLIVFLRPIILKKEINSDDIDNVSNDELKNVESDLYFCLSKLLEQIQDNYTFGQPGIQRAIIKVKEIVKRVDKSLFNHIYDNNIDFIQFSFRWVNCLLLREFPIDISIRLLDTYISDISDIFTDFHPYICAVFLVHWSKHLKQMDFQQMLLFMQRFPTQNWKIQDIESILSEAFVLKNAFQSSPKHFS
ncbi:TBC domain protein, putative [Plasmodium berghei]|uniref:TBC domain protein, putative n=2 Tax=Plasmodium berghei TaxID=5821 RepID=A0A509AQY2_PLABA|nr:TBC domain protein, putative [Plasmodium berghei ANKA]CXJ04820.1 TBC domain protein, putative [Plasmodium berghei]SCL98734.1 TBC domain protein, putative [Plasmodium berghei]SCM16886.1 TBC domain protein, putative [Plasmodium berghei]SCM18684.1 TBC domain protein, putative [Plasmodium berghei]SCN28119.1 TBC domain protein, putative [Plasmodium berghei]|eukprot:XP_034423769.1 TBC domain protein, putative [Plasmodium berghei ANKA]